MPIGETTTFPVAVVGTPRLVTIALLVPISKPDIILSGAVADDITPANVNAPVAEVTVNGSPLSSMLSLSRSWNIVAPAT